MHGVRVQMGDVVDQDRAYTTEILHALLNMYEAEWEEKGVDMPLHTVCAVIFLLVPCLGRMR